MNQTIRNDICELVFDSQKLQRGLDELIRDHDNWIRERQKDDLAKLLENIKRLEFDVILLQADCVRFMGWMYKEASDRSTAFDIFNSAFEGLNDLFTDIKKVRQELAESYIRPGEIKHLEIDWARCRKTLGKIQRCMREGGECLMARKPFESPREEKNVRIPRLY